MALFLQTLTPAVGLDPFFLLITHIPHQSITLVPASKYNQNPSPPASHLLAAILAKPPWSFSQIAVSLTFPLMALSSTVCPQQRSHQNPVRVSSVRPPLCSRTFNGSLLHSEKPPRFLQEPIQCSLLLSF